MSDDMLKDILKSADDNSEMFILMKEFFKSTGETDIRTKTEIPEKHINKIIRLKYYAEECKRYEISDEIPKISDLVDKIILENFYTLRISKKGKGREQFFSVIKGFTNQERSLKTRLFGLGER